MIRPALVAPGCAALLLATTSARPEPAEAAPIDTDRPGNGNAATTVPRGRWQLELGANYSLEEAPSSPPGTGRDREHGLTFPTALRVGVTERLELRAGTGIVGVDFAAREGKSNLGSTDTFAGTKVAALAKDGWRPDLALMVDVFFPSGSGAFTDGVVVPEARGAAFWELPADLGLLLNAGGDVPAGGEGRYLRSLYVVHLNYAPSAWAGALTLFVESFGRVPLTAAHGALVQIDLGFAWRLDDDWQIDAFTQHGLTATAPDFQGSLGLSARL